MQRRAFLAAIAGALVADPERLIWTPGARLISIPKRVIQEPRMDRETFEAGHQIIKAWAFDMDPNGLESRIGKLYDIPIREPHATRLRGLLRSTHQEREKCFDRILAV